MTREAPLAAPFPWFGGKRKVAPEVWGSTPHCVEPDGSGQLSIFGESP